MSIVLDDLTTRLDTLTKAVLSQPLRASAAPG